MLNLQPLPPEPRLSPPRTERPSIWVTLSWILPHHPESLAAAHRARRTTRAAASDWSLFDSSLDPSVNPAFGLTTAISLNNRLKWRKSTKFADGTVSGFPTIVSQSTTARPIYAEGKPLPTINWRRRRGIRSTAGALFTDAPTMRSLSPNSRMHSLCRSTCRESREGGQLGLQIVAARGTQQPEVIIHDCGIGLV